MNLEHKAAPKPIAYRTSTSGHKPTSYKTYGDRVFKFASDLRELIRTTTWGADITPKQYVSHMATLLTRIGNSISYADVLDTGHYRMIDEAISYGEGPNRNTVGHNIQKVIDDSVKYLRSIESATRAQHSAENQNGSELEHYGRLGMKWGMHIFGKDKTYDRSMKKLRKLDTKSSRYRKKADVGVYNTNQYLRNYVFGGRRESDKKNAFKSMERANKASFKSVKYEQKAKKFVESMNKEFANLSIDSFSPEDIAIGERYAVDVLQRARNASIRSI